MLDETFSTKIAVLIKINDIILYMHARSKDGHQCCRDITYHVIADFLLQYICIIFVSVPCISLLKLEKSPQQEVSCHFQSVNLTALKY